MRSVRGGEVARLRIVLLALFVALAIPSALLIRQTLSQLKWESLHEYRQRAEELSARIDATLAHAVATEEGRDYGDYRFARLAGDPGSAAITRSALAVLPPPDLLPGVLGYFQIESDGSFSTPLLPRDADEARRLGLDAGELASRQALASRLLDVLERNKLVDRRHATDALAASRGTELDRDGALVGADLAQDKKKNAAAPQSQAAFDQLNAPEQRLSNARNKLAKVSELKLGKGYQDANAQQQLEPVDEARAGLKDTASPRASRKQQAAVLEPQREAAVRRVRMFESELDPFEFNLLDSGHGVLYRKAWRDGSRTIQGAIVDQHAFLEGAVVRAFQGSTLAPMSDLVIAYQGDVIEAVRGAGDAYGLSNADELKGELLHQARLAAPFGDFQLLISANALPPGPGASLVAWSAGVLLAVGVLGFLALYALGLRQIRLARQQHDFVSAVSHELKTPLTSIRMYAEMLRAGWADDAKKREYYGFIHDEAERLSRLIADVLQLARLERNAPNLEIKPTSVATLFDLIRSKVSGPIEQAGFAARFELDPACASREAAVDADAVVQIAINLVDNALKFAARAERREVAVAFAAAGERAVVLAVRDYGPGVPRDQLRRIFELFYRAGSELTRETLGTGIGLALVRQLARAMGGEVDVANREPGAEFRVRLPAAAPRA